MRSSACLGIKATAARTIAELEAEIASLRQLENFARTLRRSGEDTKWRELDRILDDPLVHDPANDVRRKIIIFTEARDTLEYLAGRIRDRIGDEESVVTITVASRAIAAALLSQRSMMIRRYASWSQTMLLAKV